MRPALILVMLILLPISTKADKYEDAANQVHDYILNLYKPFAGWDCLVEVKDVDQNGILDFYIGEPKEWKEGGEMVVFTATVAGSVAIVTMESDWKSDKVYLAGKDNKLLAYATTADCRKCRKEFPNDPPGINGIVCFSGVWKKVK